MHLPAQSTTTMGTSRSFWFSLGARSLGTIVLLLGSLLLLVQSASPALAIDTPTLVSPADGLTTDVGNYAPLGIPNFVWNPVAGATLYHLQASQDIGFSTIQLDVASVHTTFTPSDAGPFADGIWYWRVRVESPSISPYSPARTFTKQWASPSNLPSLTSPADAANVEFYDQPRFSWTPVVGAATYLLQIATSLNGFTPPFWQQSTLDFSYQRLDKLADGIYYWRVIPKDIAGRSGTPSAVRSFTQGYGEVPTLLSPPDGDTPTFTPTFSWTAMRGAQFYRLQYSTDQSFNTAVTTVDTRNTTFTPNSPLPNDVNFYWRVRTISGDSLSDWSADRTFVKRWYLQADLLTPPNLYQYTTEPLFSWTPVPGAHSYIIEVSAVNSFPPSGGGLTDSTVNTFYVAPSFAWETNGVNPLNPVWYWRVTPIDSAGNLGKPSNVSSFVNPTQTPIVTRQIFPFYYYSPTVIYSPTIGMTPHEDRTIAYPEFSWHRILSPTNYSVLTPTLGAVNAYRVQISTSPLFLSIDWSFDTENLNAAPSAANPFTPVPGGIYYWRVRPLDAVSGSPVGPNSEIWKTRIDNSTGLAATIGVTPTLLRPGPASEWVETTPLFEWKPMQGADSYSIEVSSDPSFASSVISAIATYPLYAPVSKLSNGSYYWRVRGRNGGSPIGVYTPVWRFQIATQSRWRENRTLGAIANKNQIGSDPAGDMSDTNYDLTTLYASQAKDFWYFGFNVTGSVVSATYGLYLDVDHVDGSGATSDALGLHINTIPAHRPEFAIYVTKQSGSFAADQTFVFPWAGSSWGTPQSLDSIGGTLYYSPTAHYLEVQVPNTAIGMQDTTSSAAISLFSAHGAGGHAQDTVPTDPNVPYATPDYSGATTTLSRFSSVSERLNLTLPPSNITGDPRQLPSVLPFFWQLPVDVPAWLGYNLQVHKDPQFTSLVWDYAVIGSTLIPPDLTYNSGDLQGDNTYYWRVRPIYNATGTPRGAWSQPSAFDRQGFVPQNLATSVTFATPTFSWGMVEGTDYYELQVDDDPNFGSPVLGDSMARPLYTPASTLDSGVTYYWRVRVKRVGGVVNDWSSASSFTLNLPTATGLATVPASPVSRAPALCWTPLVQSAAGSPVFAAWRYLVQLSKNDPTFSSLFDSALTEQSCWTTSHGLDDATYYWRVAIQDGQGRQGAFTNAPSFVKQYPVTTLLSPTNGSIVSATPTFSWTPVNGAAIYHVQVSQSNQFTPNVLDFTTHNTRYTPTTDLANGTYYWRVAIIDQEGKQGPYNTATLLLGPLPNHLYLPAILR